VLLPVAMRDAPPAYRPERRAHEGAGVERDAVVLVCEDDDMVRRLVERILLGAGMRVVACATPTDALAALADGSRVDLLVTDVIMPDLSGPELARRARGLRPALPVLFLSGYTADIVRSRGDLPDDAALVEKPFEAATLLDAVREQLDVGTSAGDAHPPSR
jgi:two-component system, cell cycle sensor histidine kinase and response regulator CckA